MFSIFWRTLFSSLMLLFIGVNIAFTFNLVNVINPTSNPLDYTNYYFGVSSFIDTFKAYFGRDNLITGMNEGLKVYGRYIASIYKDFKEPVQIIGVLTKSSNPAWEIVSTLFALVLFTNNIWTTIVMIGYGIYFILYLLAFAFEIMFFVISLFGGAFATPLPNTYGSDFDSPLLNGNWGYTLMLANTLC